MRSQSGFLHSLHGADPPDERVAPLAPAQWRRHNFDDHARVTGLGARFQVVLSDMSDDPNRMWGLPFQNYVREMGPLDRPDLPRRGSGAHSPSSPIRTTTFPRA
ncbi:MAG: hypothetical protein KBD01_17920 [Acidobacteria bacterium]|nr:hypothetical protein [Acidobacteriota bacterium]